MRYIFSLFLIALTPFITSVQGQTLTDILKEIEGILPEVNDGKYTYEQVISYDDDTPYKITLTRNITQLKKGNQKEQIIEFHLGLMDKNTVRPRSDSKQMRLYIGSGRQSLINLTEDDKPKGWHDDFYIICDDISTARLLAEKIKKAIPIAKEMWETQNKIPDDYEGLLSYLKDNTNEVVTENKTISQKIESSNVTDDIVILIQESVDSKSEIEKENHEFSFGDLNEKMVKVEISRNNVGVEVRTAGKRDFILSTDEEDKKRFVEKTTILFDNPDDAFLYQNALKKIIVLGKDKMKSRVPNVTSLEQAQKIVQENLKDIKNGEKTISQEIIFTDKVSTLKMTDEEGKVEERVFSFSDFVKQVKGTFSGEYGAIKLKTTSSDRLVLVKENEEQQNYDDEISLYVSDIETMRLLEAALPVLIGETSDLVTPEDFKWLAETLNTASNTNEGKSQKLVREESNSCEVKFIVSESSDKRSSEDVLTFNLEDLESKTVQLKISGKEVNVLTYTTGREKVIQQYDKGGKLSYKDGFVFRSLDIFTAKKMKATLKKLIEECSK